MITNVPGGNAEAVAELMFGLLLSFCRKITLAEKRVREGKWDRGRALGMQLRGRTLGHHRIGSRELQSS
jgi:D-3-phosphoglycerate dehydrogenase